MDLDGGLLATSLAVEFTGPVTWRGVTLACPACGQARGLALVTGTYAGRWQGLAAARCPCGRLWEHPLAYPKAIGLLAAARDAGAGTDPVIPASLWSPHHRSVFSLAAEPGDGEVQVRYGDWNAVLSEEDWERDHPDLTAAYWGEVAGGAHLRTMFRALAQASGGMPDRASDSVWQASYRALRMSVRLEGVAVYGAAESVEARQVAATLLLAAGCLPPADRAEFEAMFPAALANARAHAADAEPFGNRPGYPSPAAVVGGGWCRAVPRAALAPAAAVADAAAVLGRAAAEGLVAEALQRGDAWRYLDGPDGDRLIFVCPRGVMAEPAEYFVDWYER